MKRTHRQIGKLSKQKGSAFEREVANRLREIYPNAKRGLGQARAAGEVSDVTEVGPWWIETKAHRKPRILAALLQAEEAAKENAISNGGKGLRVPIAITKADRTEPVVTLYLDDFIDLLLTLKDLELDSKHEAMVQERTVTDQESLPTPGSVEKARKGTP